MLLTCPHCGDSNELPRDRLPPTGVRGSCGRCGQVVVFDGLGLVAEGGDADATPPNPLEAETSSEDATPLHPLDAVAVAEEAAAAGDEWHVNTPTGRQGPLTLAAVKQLIRTGELSELDHVYGPGQTDWIAANDREELKRYFAIKAKAQARAAGAAGAAAATTAAGSAELNASDPFAWCTRHATVEASWICHGCNLSWCRTCPGDKDLPGGRLKTCPQCQRPVKEREKAKPITLWWTELSAVWRFPIEGMNWLAIVVLCGFWLMSLMSSMAAMYGFISRIIISFAILSWYVLLIRNISTGGRGMPDLGKVERYFGELFVPGFKATVVGILTFIPLMLYLLFVVAPTAVEYAAASAQVAMAEEEEARNEEWADEESASEESWAGDSTGGGGSGLADDDQREAFVEAMRSMGHSEEAIEEMLAEWDQTATEAGGDSSGGGWGSDDDWEDPWKPEPPSGFGLMLTLLGVPVLLIYALVVWPLLLIIVALFNTIAPAFNPPLILRIAKEVWPEYKRLLFILVPLGLVSFMVGWFAEPNFSKGMQLAQWGFPPFLRLLLVPVSIYLDLVMMYLIGRTAELIDRKIDWF